MMVSPMFLFTWVGVALVMGGVALVVLYNRRWTQIVCSLAVLVGAGVMMKNHTFVVWDLISGISFSVAPVIIVFLALFAALRLGFLDIGKDSPYREMTDAELGITWRIRLKSWFRSWC